MKKKMIFGFYDSMMKISVTVQEIQKECFILHGCSLLKLVHGPNNFKPIIGKFLWKLNILDSRSEVL